MTRRSTLLGDVSIGLMVLVAASLMAVGCRDRKPKPLINHAEVVRCERGTKHAAAQKTLDEAMSVYYRSCAGIHAQKECRDAFTAASKASADKRMATVVEGCTKAYCGVLGGDRYEICRPNFQASTAGITRAWPPFHNAIIEHDAKGLASRINNALLGFYLKTKDLGKAEPEDKPKDAGAKAAADGAAAASAAVPSASVAPPASGAPAAPGSAPAPKSPPPAASAKKK